MVSSCGRNRLIDFAESDDAESILLRYSIGGCAPAERSGIALSSIIAIVSSNSLSSGESLLTCRLDSGVGKEVRWYFYL